MFQSSTVLYGWFWVYFWCNIFYYHSMKIFLPFHWPKAHHVTANNFLQIMVCSCAMSSNCVLLQIIFCSCVNDRSCVKKGRWLCFPKMVVKKNKLGGRMIKQFLIRLSRNIAICQSLAHQLFCLSLRLRQIIDLLATDKSPYFAQLRPIILFTAHLKQRKQTSLTMNLTLTMVHKTKKTNQ